jgi:hypothetical protein
MKKITILLALALLVAVTLPAVAEVEEVTVGGSVVVRGQLQTPGVGQQRGPVNVGGFTNGHLIDANGNGVIEASDLTFSLANFNNFVESSSFDDDIEGLDWITQRTRVNVDAKLSGNVRAFIELQSFDFWGDDNDDSSNEDLNASDVSPFTTEQMFITTEGDDLVQLYQGYIEMNNIADLPLQARIGRQELPYGREWLLGNNDAGVNFSGLAFDALKLSYETDLFRLDAFASKLDDDTTPLAIPNQEEDGDADLYGVYGTYKGIENMAIDAYWLFARDAGSLVTLTGADADTDDVSDLHTAGARVAGQWDVMGLLPGMLDYNVEAAFQFGSNNVADSTGDSGDFGGWAFNAMAGYTFSEVTWTPRLEAEYAFFSGDDDFNDGDTDEFVRLFSDVHYGELNLGGDLDQLATNMHIIKLGVSAAPVEKLSLKADLLWFLLAEDDKDGLGKTFGLPQFERTGAVVAGQPVEVIGSDDNVGMELDLVASYQYTEDLNLRAGWAHFFADDAIENSWGAGKDDDIDYVYVQAALVF